MYNIGIDLGIKTFAYSIYDITKNKIVKYDSCVLLNGKKIKKYITLKEKFEIIDNLRKIIDGWPLNKVNKIIIEQQKILNRNLKFMEIICTMYLYLQKVDHNYNYEIILLQAKKKYHGRDYPKQYNKRKNFAIKLVEELTNLKINDHNICDAILCSLY